MAASSLLRDDSLFRQTDVSATVAIATAKALPRSDNSCQIPGIFWNDEKQGDVDDCTDRVRRARGEEAREVRAVVVRVVAEGIEERRLS